jgi:GrpB-like predicted nucleotidyltransferase (UPF0157 family)
MLIQQYEKKWIEDFNKIQKIITETLSSLKISIEHIGSTSIPELAAKPIIDIDIVFEEVSAFNKIKMRLNEIGYYHRNKIKISITLIQD